MLEIFSLAPAILKALPVILAAVLYALFRWERSKRLKAEAERNSARASYELAEEVNDIEGEGDKASEALGKLDNDALANAYHDGVCKPPKS